MRLLDLFSGIGGFSLGLERAGFQTVAFCEIDPFCRRVLNKHWPKVPVYDDVRSLTAERLRADGIIPDIICGGFPCQDISVAGKGAGLAGERSGLWSEYARIIGEIRPRYVIVENVAALLGRGLDRVLGDLAALGFDAEWHCIPASAVGAPHRRDRVWIVAYPSDTIGGQLRHEPGRRDGSGWPGAAELGDNGAPRIVSNPDSWRCLVEREPQHAEQQGASGREPDGLRAPGRRDGPHVADADSRGRREQGHVGEEASDARAGQSSDGREDVADAKFGRGQAIWQRLPALGEAIREGRQRNTSAGNADQRGWWAAEPDVGRVVTRDADRVDRRKRLIALGNGLVPQIPEMIGRAILAAEADNYDPDDDMSKSTAECYRERVAAGGPGWVPKQEE